MAFVEKFSVEEWGTLKYSLLWVFNAVAGADDKVDKSEKKALSSIVANSGKFFNDLARELFMEIEKDFDTLTKEFEGDARDLQTGLREVAEVLKGKIDDEIALNFKKTLIAIGIFIGHSSGSWFGSNLSDEEVDMVKRVGELLGVTIGELEKPPNLQQIIQNLEVS